MFLILTSYAWPETTVISFLQALLLINHVGTTTALMRKDEQIKQKLLDPPSILLLVFAQQATDSSLDLGPVVGDTCFIAFILYLWHTAACPVLL